MCGWVSLYFVSVTLLLCVDYCGQGEGLKILSEIFRVSFFFLFLIFGSISSGQVHELRNSIGLLGFSLFGKLIRLLVRR